MAAASRKKAIERRGTTNLEAYNLYLMARQYNITGTIGNGHRSEYPRYKVIAAAEARLGVAGAWARRTS